VEGELDFITFEELLEHLEELMCRVLEVTMEDATIKQYIIDLNPEFTMPERPFLRMKYTDAVRALLLELLHHE
jgi:asparaginyl-tRNA synthetase